jgi:hypothetical protein
MELLSSENTKQNMRRIMMNAILEYIGLIGAVIAIVSVFVGGLWAYFTFIFTRGILPPVEFSVNYQKIGVHKGYYLLQVIFAIKNLGVTPLVISNINARINYLNENDEVNIFRSNNLYGRVNICNSLGKWLLTGDTSNANSRICSSIPILKSATFVQYGLKQEYTLITAIPESAVFLLVHGSFQYGAEGFQRNKFINFVYGIGKNLSLIQYSLKNVIEPHTAERLFCLRD